jgi:hypothetical protein
MKLMSKVVLAAVIGSLCILAGATAFATQGNSTVTPLAMGTLTGAVHSTTRVTGGRVTVEAKGALSVIVSQLTLPPGGTSGWHSHAGPHFEVVNQGTLTEINSKGCKTETMQAGQASYDGKPSDIVNAVNRGSDPLIVTQTFLVPKGTLPRIDQPAPPNCPT